MFSQKDPKRVFLNVTVSLSHWNWNFHTKLAFCARTAHKWPADSPYSHQYTGATSERSYTA